MGKIRKDYILGLTLYAGPLIESIHDRRVVARHKKYSLMFNFFARQDNTNENLSTHDRSSLLFALITLT